MHTVQLPVMCLVNVLVLYSGDVTLGSDFTEIHLQHVCRTCSQMQCNYAEIVPGERTFL